MPFLMVRNDIVRMETDAIVNPSNRRLLQGRGTSRGIFLAAGERELTLACMQIGSCEVGKAVMTPGFALKAKYIIHAVCPAWRGGEYGEEELLYSAYAESMKLAHAQGLESIAFPLLSSGNYGYPKEPAMRTAVRAIRDFLADHEMTVYLVLYDRQSVEVREEIAASLKEYLADHFVEWIDDKYAKDKDESYYPPNVYEAGYLEKESRRREDLADYSPRPMSMPAEPSAARPRRKAAGSMSAPSGAALPPGKKRSLDNLVKSKPETFSEMLLRLIDEKGLKDSDVYNKANIDRRHFSKIRKDPGYMPKKSTVLSFAIALELSCDETKDLLMRAGYAFSDCLLSDVIIRYFIEDGNYDIFDINEALFYYRQPVLGE